MAVRVTHFAAAAWVALMLLLGAAAPSAASAAEESLFVRGYAGEASGGFKVKTPTHLGNIMVQGARQVAPDLKVQWRSAPAPASLAAPSVTFVWSGGTGGGALGGGNFTLFVNGRAAADFDAAARSTRFPAKEAGCELLYMPLWAAANGAESSGHFYLTVPASWVQAGQPARLEVRGRDIGEGYWFALIPGNDAPLAKPKPKPLTAWTEMIRRNQPALPPPPGTEASYEWYLAQYDEPSSYAPVGPPADPAETAISLAGQIFANPDGNVKPTPWTTPRLFWDGLLFTLYEDGKIVHVGDGEPARQSLVGGYLPIVETAWKHGDLEWRETAFGEPLRGAGYQTGMEQTLVWAAIEIRDLEYTKVPVIMPSSCRNGRH